MDKIEEYKINTLIPRMYGGTLSWLAADGKDDEQTDGIATSEAIKKLDDFAERKSIFSSWFFFRPSHSFCCSKKIFRSLEREK